MNYKALTLAIVGILIAIIFRSAGLINDLWIGLVVAAAIGAIAILQTIPTVKLTLLSKIFLVWLAVAIASSYLSKEAPQVTEAIQNRKSFEATLQAAGINPPAREAYTAYWFAVTTMDKNISWRINSRMMAVLKKHDARQISTPQLYKEMEKFELEIANHNNRMKQLLELLTEDRPQSRSRLEPVANITQTTARTVFWILGALLVAAAIGSMFTSKPVFKTALGVAFIVGLLLGVDHLLSGGGTKFLQQLDHGSAISAPQKNVIVVQIPPGNQLSRLVTLPKHSNFRIEPPGYMEMVFSNGKVIKAPKDQDINVGEISNLEFRLRGDHGKVIITII